ncbi:YihY/virulence factor BrkB family protein [Mesorhizobium sp. LHD-90]|uniref:YihY/virulence factor BrkB family protein n=1 Tax=Mesorhizobium sp. LHD-90 TaxID=3071414 RepID=UPI0027DFDC62|nr:YihY/virulence factor BrkB family protein [Mesorhizobium sp. LHD-90]MDQ6436631.1 YihY/virulence factor BrkB family protein [Mesorhizobium sp. LHD-90]
MKPVLGRVWTLARTAVVGFINDNALTHAAAMAFYAATSLAPILLIVIAIAGLAVGRDAAQLAVTAQLTGLLGPQGADLLKSIIEGASNSTSGVIAASIALITLIASASGVFGEMQSSLNQIWKVEPSSNSLSGLVRARAASLGLVASLGFLLLVSLAASAAISGLADFINSHLAFGEAILSLINTIVSLSLLALLFGAIYKVLPDRSLAWRDVRFGAVTTAVLFTIGKSLIGWYLGTSAVASSYGAAGSLIVLLLWVFYSSSIFLLGAELTRAYATSFGTRPDLKRLTTSAPDDPILSRPQVSANRSPYITLVLIALVSAVATAIASSNSGNRRERY